MKVSFHKWTTFKGWLPFFLIQEIRQFTKVTNQTPHWRCSRQAQPYRANINICQAGKLCKKDSAKLVIGNVAVGQKTTLNFWHLISPTRLNHVKISGVSFVTPDYSIVHMVFIYWLLLFSLLFREKKNYVKPFLAAKGYKDWTCFHSNRSIIKTASGHVEQSVNPLNGILRANFTPTSSAAEYLGFFCHILTLVLRIRESVFFFCHLFSSLRIIFVFS